MYVLIVNTVYFMPTSHEIVNVIRKKCFQDNGGKYRNNHK